MKTKKKSDVPKRTLKIPEDNENTIEFTDAENLFEDLDFTKEENITLKIKADLYAHIVAIIREKKYTQHRVSMILDIPQPRVSNILCGKIDGISIDSLLDYTSKLDPKLRIKLETDRRRAM